MRPIRARLQRRHSQASVLNYRRQRPASSDVHLSGGSGQGNHIRKEAGGR